MVLKAYEQVFPFSFDTFLLVGGGGLLCWVISLCLNLIQDLHKY